jgi:hypothetical protein
LGSPGSIKGMPWRTCRSNNPAAHAAFVTQRKSQMPKLKTKSGAKKRFKLSATGKVIAGARASVTA